VDKLSTGFHTCALLQSGGVRCWGLGTFGRLGYANTENVGDFETPAEVGDVNLGAGRVVGLSVEGHTCVVIEGGRVRCWGPGTSGALGYGNTLPIGDDEDPARAGDVDVGAPVLQVATGFSHTCALLTNGAVRCWGRSRDGELGRGSTQNLDNQAPASVAPIRF
jgi:alpha-tubulin suppressor-like RCC1 family protein